MSTKSALEFASWLRESHPQIYKRAAKAADASVAHKAEAMERRSSGLGLAAPETTTAAKTGWFDTFMQAAAGLGTTYLSLKNQRDQLKINMTRAEQGLEPLDFAGQPIITTEVQLPQGTIDKITASAGMNINKILLFAGLAAAAFYFLK